MSVLQWRPWKSLFIVHIAFFLALGVDRHVMRVDALLCLNASSVPIYAADIGNRTAANYYNYAGSLSNAPISGFDVAVFGFTYTASTDTLGLVHILSRATDTTTGTRLANGFMYFSPPFNSSYPFSISLSDDAGEASKTNASYAKLTFSWATTKTDGAALESVSSPLQNPYTLLIQYSSMSAYVTGVRIHSFTGYEESASSNYYFLSRDQLFSGIQFSIQRDPVAVARSGPSPNPGGSVADRYSIQMAISPAKGPTLVVSAFQNSINSILVSFAGSLEQYSSFSQMAWNLSLVDSENGSVVVAMLNFTLSSNAQTITLSGIAPGEYVLYVSAMDICSFLGQATVPTQICRLGYWRNTSLALSGTYPYCTPCDPGFSTAFLNATSAVSCVACANGQYSNSSSHFQCTACPAGQTSAPGRGSCMDCAIGTYSNSTTALLCISCPDGEESKSPVRDACLPCGVGQYSNSSTSNVCVSCPSGTQPNTGQSGCAVCSTGQYANSSTSNVCVSCPSGTQPNTGQSGCAVCSTGQYANSSTSNVCVSCPSGSEPSMGRDACAPCDNGKYSNFSTSFMCESCPLGHEPFGPFSSCRECTAGKFSNATVSFECKFCPPGTEADASRSHCVNCASGRFSNSSTGFLCSPCPTGSEPSEDRSVCIPCPAGYYSNASTAFSCTSCSVGYASSSDRAACVPCQSGQFVNSSTAWTCVQCPDGHESSSSLDHCVPCFSGRFSNASVAYHCTYCTDGTQPNTDQRACVACAPGMYSNSSSGFLCKYCPAGTQPSASFSGCDPCVVGTFSNATSGYVCVSCDDGHEPSASRSICAKCPLGTYSNDTVQHLCTMCPNGYEPSADGSHCRPCSPGWYSNSSSLHMCSPCPAGFGSDLFRASCVLCPINRISGANRTDYPSCQVCADGYEPDLTQSSCVPCSVGAVSNSHTSYRCSVCPLGFSTPGPASNSCSVCSSGFFGPNCTICPSCWNGGTCRDGMSGNGSCICGGMFAGPYCVNCSVNFYGNSCNVFCSRASSCSGHGSCSSDGHSCVCDAQWTDSSCSTFVNPNSLRDPPAALPGGAVGGGAAEGAVAGTTVGASVSSSGGAISLFDAVQAITRMACLRINFPVWYIEFVQATNIASFQFRLTFLTDPLQSLGFLDESPDPGMQDSDPNLRLYMMGTLDTYSCSFIIQLISLVFVYSAIACCHLVFLGVLYLVFMIRLYWKLRVLADCLIAVQSLKLATKTWIFFRGLYFAVFFGSYYGVFVSIMLLFSKFFDQRPLWESVAAIFVCIIYLSLSYFWVIRSLRHTRTMSPELFHTLKKWDTGFLEFGHNWFVYPGLFAIFIVDAALVVAGALDFVSQEVQLSIVLLFSALRSMFFLVYQPSSERRGKIMSCFNSSLDTLMCCVLYSMIGLSRDSIVARNVTLPLAICQFVQVIINILLSVFEMIVSVGSFALYLAALLKEVVVAKRWIMQSKARKKSEVLGIKLVPSDGASTTATPDSTSDVSMVPSNPLFGSNGLRPALLPGSRRGPRLADDDSLTDAAGLAFAAPAAHKRPSMLAAPKTFSPSAMLLVDVFESQKQTASAPNSKLRLSVPGLQIDGALPNGADPRQKVASWIKGSAAVLPLIGSKHTDCKVKLVEAVETTPPEQQGLHRDVVGPLSLSSSSSPPSSLLVSSSVDNGDSPERPVCCANDRLEPIDQHTLDSPAVPPLAPEIALQDGATHDFAVGKEPLMIHDGNNFASTDHGVNVSAPTSHGRCSPPAAVHFGAASEISVDAFQCHSTAQVDAPDRIVEVSDNNDGGEIQHPTDENANAKPRRAKHRTVSFASTPIAPGYADILQKMSPAVSVAAPQMENQVHFSRRSAAVSQTNGSDMSASVRAVSQSKTMAPSVEWKSESARSASPSALHAAGIITARQLSSGRSSGRGASFLFEPMQSRTRSTSSHQLGPAESSSNMSSVDLLLADVESRTPRSSSISPRRTNSRKGNDRGAVPEALLPDIEHRQGSSSPLPPSVPRRTAKEKARKSQGASASYPDSIHSEFILADVESRQSSGAGASRASKKRF
eukprot:ANDGO_00451.mRNA.1 Laminin subunit beta-1